MKEHYLGPDEDEGAGYKQNAASKHTSNPARGGIVWWRQPLFVSHTWQLDHPTLQRDGSSRAVTHGNWAYFTGGRRVNDCA